ncbi:diguanylate cyclase [Mariprofundus erugo]|nr:diguanylate cyclase [Mariprofundus erugo]
MSHAMIRRKKLAEMMNKESESSVPVFKFGDLVDVTSFGQLLESFFKATGIPNGLVAPGGELITQAGWVDACVYFHRANPDMQHRCHQSNIRLMGKLHNGEVTGCLCENGLYDYATPVVIEGQQLATLFLGQVFSEEPDMEFFRKQAELFKFDETSYLNAIRAVPIVSKARMEAHMACMVGMAQVLASNGLARLRETKLEHDLQKSSEQRIELEDLLNLSPIGIGWSDANGTVEYVNRRFTELFGYTLGDLPDLSVWYQSAYPDPDYREKVVVPWQQAVALAHQEGTVPPELEVNVTCRDGSVRRVVIRVSWVGNKRLVNFSDITDHWQSELRNRAHDAMLEMVARGLPLSDILSAIVSAIEAEEPSSLCSVLLLDQESQCLYTGAAPGLPDFYNNIVNGLKIGMGVGSCGTAAFSGKRVIVEDISTHEYWRVAAEIAQQANLGSCWSEPIFGSKGNVLGTFAIYHSQPSTPSPEDIERITFAANIAAIAIENRNTRDELAEREREFRSLAENAPDNIARYDLHGRMIYANPRLEQTLHAPAEKMLGRRPTEHAQGYECYESQLMHVIETGEEVSFEFGALGTMDDTPTHLIHMVAERDEAGAIVGVLAIGRDISERKQMEQLLEAREREFRTLAENAPVLIARYDCEGRLLYSNPKLKYNFPVPVETVIGKRLDEFPELPFAAFFMDKVSQIVTTGEARVFETEVPGIDGEETHLVSMVAERDESGAISGILTIGQDITGRKRMERELERQAHFDALTGLANRRYFLQQAESEIGRCRRYGGTLSLTMFDIDFFKKVNDSYGHDVGDQVLRKVADWCGTVLRDIDTIGRLGGEEFAILMPQTDLQQGLDVAERLRMAMAGDGIALPGGDQLGITASFGVVTLDEGEGDIDALLIRADQAMYRAKKAGRNRVCSGG